MDLQKSRQPHPLIWLHVGFRPQGSVGFSFTRQRKNSSISLLAHGSLCFFHFMKDSLDQGVDAQHSLSAKKMSTVYFQQNGPLGTTTWREELCEPMYVVSASFVSGFCYPGSI